MNKEKSIAMCAIGVIAIMLAIIFATVLIYEKNTQTIEKASEQVEKSIKNRTNLVKKAKSEKATCYVDGKKQDEDFDPEGLSVDNYEVKYTDHCLYFKKNRKVTKINRWWRRLFPYIFSTFSLVDNKKVSKGAVSTKLGY